MARENPLYGEARPLPYLVRLATIKDDARDPYAGSRPILMHLDLRGGEFSRATSARLAKTFDWITRAYRLGRDLSDYCLAIAPMRFDQAEEVTGSRETPYIPDDWPTPAGTSFLWVPVPYDETEVNFAWQK